MMKKLESESELFFWVKSGNERKEQSIHGIQKKKTAAPKIKMIKNKPKSDVDTARAGLKTGWIRATLILREANLNKIKALAYWERKNIKDVMDEALNAYLGVKEIKPLPDNKI